MKQICNDDYWKYMEKLKPEEAPCGQPFDDLHQMTYCPHPTFDKVGRTVTIPEEVKNDGNVRVTPGDDS